MNALETMTEVPKNAAVNLIQEGRAHGHQFALLALFSGMTNQQVLPVLTKLIEDTLGKNRDGWCEIVRTEVRNDQYAVTYTDCGGYLGLWLAVNSAIGKETADSSAQIQRAVDLYVYFLKVIRPAHGSTQYTDRNRVLSELAMNCLWLIHEHVESQEESWLRLVYSSLCWEPELFNKCMTRWSEGVNQIKAIILAKYLRNHPKDISKIVKHEMHLEPDQVLRHLWRVITLRNRQAADMLRLIELVEPVVAISHRPYVHIVNSPKSLDKEAVQDSCIRVAVEAAQKVSVFASKVIDLIKYLSQPMHGWFALQNLEFNLEKCNLDKIVFKVFTGHAELSDYPVDTKRAKVGEAAKVVGEQMSEILKSLGLSNRPDLVFEATYKGPATPTPAKETLPEILILRYDHGDEI